MSNFDDIEQFGREHGGCGGITPSAAPQANGGFLLTLMCTCGATLDCWVTSDEAKRPLPLPPSALTSGARSAAPTRPPAAPNRDLDAVMRAAVEAEDAAAAPPETPAASAPAPPPPPLDEQQRAALGEIVKSLNKLQAGSALSTGLSVYGSRVAFAKSDVERFLESTAPGPARTGVREVLDIHLLAAAAWRARSLDEKDVWEAVGQEPAIDLCPSVRRVVDFAVQPAGVSRAQARGVALASSVPLLWECAAQKLAALEPTPPAP